MSVSDQRCAAGKLGYTRRLYAAKAAKHLAAKGRPGMRAYRCGTCDLYHIGHADAGQRERVREVVRARYQQA